MLLFWDIFNIFLLGHLIFVRENILCRMALLFWVLFFPILIGTPFSVEDLENSTQRYIFSKYIFGYLSSTLFWDYIFWGSFSGYILIFWALFFNFKKIEVHFWAPYWTRPHFIMEGVKLFWEASNVFLIFGYPFLKLLQFEDPFWDLSPFLKVILSYQENSLIFY